MTPEDLAYAESVRAIELQSRALDEVRSRSGVLLAGASIVTSFLGSEALRGSGLDAVSIGALLAFVGVIALVLAILWPRGEWRFALGAKVLLEDWGRDDAGCGDARVMKRFVAETIEANFEKNKTAIDLLLRLYRWAVAVLGAEVVLWTLKLA